MIFIRNKKGLNLDDIQELTAETKEILLKTDEERFEYISKTYWIDYPIARYFTKNGRFN